MTLHPIGVLVLVLVLSEDGVKCFPYGRPPDRNLAFSTFQEKDNHWHWRQLSYPTKCQSTPFTSTTLRGNFIEDAWNKLSGREDDDWDDSTVYRLPLDLEMERQLQLRREPPIATLTWMTLEDHETSEMAVQFLKERAAQIAVTNPWLQTGHLQRQGVNPLEAAELVFQSPFTETPKIEIASTQDAQYLQRYGHDRPLPGRSDAYKLTRKYTSLQEYSSSSPMWRITVIPAYGAFGLILSVSHLVADIHTYYKIYDMLTNPHQEIGTLDLNTPYMEDDNDDEYSSSSDDLAQFHVGGPRVWRFIHSPWLRIKRFLGTLERTIWRTMVIGAMPDDFYYDVDEDRYPIKKLRPQGVEYWFEIDPVDLQQVKEQLICEEEGEVDDRIIDDEEEWSIPLEYGSEYEYDNEYVGYVSRDPQNQAPPYPSPVLASNPRQQPGPKNRQSPIDSDIYVSTNDILSAWFFQMTRCRMGLISCNYRGKLEGHHEYLARNYWGYYALAPDQFVSPFAVRQHIRRPSASEKAFPILAAELLQPTPLGEASSWTVPFDSDTFSPVESHWPLYDFASYCPAQFVVLKTWWIQRPNSKMEGRIGVYVAGDAKWLAKPMESWGMIPSFLRGFI